MIIKIKTKQQLITMIQNNEMIHILTNGMIVYAQVASIDKPNNMIEQWHVTDSSFVPYMIEKDGRLLHCNAVHYPVLKKFVQKWFPNCYYASHIKEYDDHNGLFLFLEESPERDFIRRCWSLKIISNAQPHFNLAKKGTFVLFTEGNEPSYEKPHVHVCVSVDNKIYQGAPLRCPHWSAQYKSIFSISLNEPKENDSFIYTIDNLIIRDRVEVDCLDKMSLAEKQELIDMLNAEHPRLYWDWMQNNDKLF